MMITRSQQRPQSPLSQENKTPSPKAASSSSALSPEQPNEMRTEGSPQKSDKTPPQESLFAAQLSEQNQPLDSSSVASAPCVPSFEQIEGLPAPSAPSLPVAASIPAFKPSAVRTGSLVSQEKSESQVATASSEIAGHAVAVPAYPMSQAVSSASAAVGSTAESSTNAPSSREIIEACVNITSIRINLAGYKLSRQITSEMLVSSCQVLGIESALAFKEIGFMGSVFPKNGLKQALLSGLSSLTSSELFKFHFTLVKASLRYEDKEEIKSLLNKKLFASFLTPKQKESMPCLSFEAAHLEAKNFLELLKMQNNEEKIEESLRYLLDILSCDNISQLREFLVYQDCFSKAPAATKKIIEERLKEVENTPTYDKLWAIFFQYSRHNLSAERIENKYQKLIDEAASGENNNEIETLASELTLILGNSELKESIAKIKQKLSAPLRVQLLKFAMKDKYTLTVKLKKLADYLLGHFPEILASVNFDTPFRLKYLNELIEAELKLCVNKSEQTKRASQFEKILGSQLCQMLFESFDTSIETVNLFAKYLVEDSQNSLPWRILARRVHSLFTLNIYTDFIRTFVDKNFAKLEKEDLIEFRIQNELYMRMYPYAKILREIAVKIEMALNAASASSVASSSVAATAPAPNQEMELLKIQLQLKEAELKAAQFKLELAQQPKSTQNVATQTDEVEPGALS